MLHDLTLSEDRLKRQRKRRMCGVKVVHNLLEAILSLEIGTKMPPEP